MENWNQKKFYGVRKGRNVGVYLNWKDVLKQIQNFPFPVFRKFPTYEEAYQFVHEKNELKDSSQWKISANDSSFHFVIQKNNNNNQENETKKEESEKRQNISHCVWLEGNKPNDTRIHRFCYIWDHENKEKMKLNYVGFYEWKNHYLRNRIRLAALIRLVSFLSENAKNFIDHIIFVCTTSKYLVNTINDYLLKQFEASTIQRNEYYDMLQFLGKQLLSSSFKIRMVLVKKDDEKIALCSEFLKKAEVENLFLKN